MTLIKSNKIKVQIFGLTAAHAKVEMFFLPKYDTLHFSYLC